jgi:prevent-host-death family protein
MQEIGVRELKQALSRTLRAVARGETVRITLYGRPVADLVPAGSGADGLRQLIREGRVTAPAHGRPAMAPLMASARARTASDLILAERDAER